MKIRLNYSDMAFILHKTVFKFMTPSNFKLELANKHFDNSDQLNTVQEKIQYQYSFIKFLMIIGSIAENSDPDELSRKEKTLYEQKTSPMLYPIEALLTLLSTEQPDYRDITIIDIIAGIIYSKRNNVRHILVDNLMLAAKEELKRLEEFYVQKIQVNPQLESELRILKSSLLELDFDYKRIQSTKDNTRPKKRNIAGSVGNSSGDSINSLYIEALSKKNEQIESTKKEISEIQGILTNQAEEKVANNPNWQAEMDGWLFRINQLKFGIDNLDTLQKSILQRIPTSSLSSITTAVSGELHEAEKKRCWDLACALVIQYRSVYGIEAQMYMPVQPQKLHQYPSLDPNSDDYPSPYKCNDLAMIILGSIVMTSIIAIAAPLCLLAGHYIVSAGLLLIPSLFSAYWAVRQISSEFPVLMQDFLTRPRVACAFIVLSSLLLAATVVGVFFMWQAVLPAYHLTGYIAFGVLTTLMASVAILLTFPVKMLVNNLDGHLAQKSDSYASTHSGFMIEEEKLQATCEKRGWNINVTREALRTLAAKYEKITIENFPMNPNSEARAIIKDFSLILNGEYHDAEGKSSVIIKVDSSKHQFELSDSFDYSASISRRFFSNSAAAAPQPASDSVYAGAGVYELRLC